MNVNLKKKKSPVMLLSSHSTLFLVVCSYSLDAWNMSLNLLLRSLRIAVINEM